MLNIISALLQIVESQILQNRTFFLLQAICRKSAFINRNLLCGAQEYSYSLYLFFITSIKKQTIAVITIYRSMNVSYNDSQTKKLILFNNLSHWKQNLILMMSIFPRTIYVSGIFTCFGLRYYNLPLTFTCLPIFFNRKIIFLIMSPTIFFCTYYMTLIGCLLNNYLRFIFKSPQIAYY